MGERCFLCGLRHFFKNRSPVSPSYGEPLNPPEADKGFIPRCLRSYNAIVDIPLLRGGAVHPLNACLFYSSGTTTTFMDPVTSG